MREGTTSRVTAADRPYGEFKIFIASVRKLWLPPCILQISMPHVVGGQQFGHYEYKSRLYARDP